jgi:hypothetical protein
MFRSPSRPLSTGRHRSVFLDRSLNIELRKQTMNMKMRSQIGLLTAAVLMASAGPTLAQSPPFAGLAGAWKGAGSISLSDGTSERLRCRATYRVDGGQTALQQTLRCASDSYKIELSSYAVGEGGHVSGSWNEESRGLTGTLTGTAMPGRLSLAVASPAFSANLSLVTRGDKQTVSIISEGEIRNVSISLTRI